ncbi:hypothetical protein BGW39_000448 [Mortierella sp. 14UC]|nr:hypothetical protein BGW39_000448 [Mortierella sp. 14UC]
MHFSTTVASASILVLAAGVASVSGQQVPSDACSLCFGNAAMAASPTCTVETLLTQALPIAMTPAEKACICPLISSYTWIQTCSKPDGCTAAEIGLITSSYTENDKTVICGTVAPTGAPPPSTGTGAAPPSATATPPSATAIPGAGGVTGNPSTPTPPKSDAVALFGPSSKALVGVALGVASAVALLL